MLPLPIKYALFALLSMCINLLTQYLSLNIYNKKYSLYIAIFFGTLIGLIVKFVLDKKLIFYYRSKTKSQDIYKFILYSFLGVFTTLIYWGFEISFDYFLSFSAAKYIGAVTGLTIGYLIKYNLDKRFVFK
ncbi:MAG: GtrA family protein [Clostridia bacterium]|nr:GtrA family protein [Clostridia bacterium]